MILSEALKKERNNLDIFRIAAAYMVIYGHAYAILPTSGESDWVASILKFDYSGSLAVKVFFFLSGLVVTNSLLESRSLQRFMVSRVFRVWPAYMAVLVVTSVVIGPIVSAMNMRDYMTQPSVYSYVFDGALLHIRYELPGVFSGHALTAVNGSLWSIPIEIGAYLILMLFFIFGVVQRRWLALSVFILLLVSPIRSPQLVLTWLPDNKEVTLLAPCFAFGALLAIWKDKIYITLPLVFACCTLCALFWVSSVNFYFFYLALFIAIIYLSTCAFMVSIKAPFDISYGVYLWGWPVQQILASLLAGYGLLVNQLVAIVVASLLGLLSWFLIERRCIDIGSRCVNF